MLTLRHRDLEAPQGRQGTARLLIAAALGGLIVLLSACAASAQQSPNLNRTTENPIVRSTDGSVSSPTEWSMANAVPDGIGTLYGESKESWLAISSTGSSMIYAGMTGFLLHDMSLAPTQEMADYNLFEITTQYGTVTLWVLANADTSVDSVWVRQSGLAGSSLIPEATGDNLIIDSGFIVRQNYDPATDRHWLPGMPEPGDTAFSWDDWYGIFGTSGFNNSAFVNGLPLAIDGGNEVYEVAFRRAGASTPGQPPNACWWAIIRIVADPKTGKPNWVLVGWVFDWVVHFPFWSSIWPNESPGLICECPPGMVFLEAGLPYEIAFTATDPNGTTPAITSSAGIIPGTSFIDHGDGTGTLQIVPQEDQVCDSLCVGVVANDGSAQSNYIMVKYGVVATGGGVEPVPTNEPGLSGLPSVTTASCYLKFGTALTQPATVAIFDVSGGLVRRIKAGAGAGGLTWDGTDDSGHPVSSGVYLIRLTGSNVQETTRVIVLR